MTYSEHDPEKLTHLNGERLLHAEIRASMPRPRRLSIRHAIGWSTLIAIAAFALAGVWLA